jgi:hypothetical protein
MKKIIFAISCISLFNIQLQTFASSPQKSGGAWAAAKPIIAGAGIVWGTGITCISLYRHRKAPKNAQHIKKIKDAATSNGDYRGQIIIEHANSLSWYYADKNQKDILHNNAQYIVNPKCKDIAEKLNYSNNRNGLFDPTEERRAAQQFVTTLKDIENEVWEDNFGKRKLKTYAALGIAAIGGGIWLLKKK